MRRVFARLSSLRRGVVAISPRNDAWVPWHWLASVGLVLLGGCGESGDPFTLTVEVHDRAGSTVSLPGAAVALDRADGSRSECVTNASGACAFEHANGSGPFAFTVAAAGYVAVSDVGLTRGGGWHVTLSRFGTDPTWMDLTGVVLGKADVNHTLVISSIEASSQFRGTGPEYSLRVAPKRTSLVVAELTYGPAPATAQGRTTTFVNWTEFSVDPVTSSRVDLALAGAAPTASAVIGTSLAPTSAAGLLRVPASMQGASGGLTVSNRTSSGSTFLGAGTVVDLAADHINLAYVAEYVMPTTDLQTVYWLRLGNAWSYAAADGAPGGDIGFLNTPSLASPQPLYGPLPVQTNSAGLKESVNIASDDMSTVWRVYNEGATDGTKLWLPRLPSSIDPRTVLGTGRVSAIPEVCLPDPTRQRCSLWAVGTPADLVGP